MTAGACVSTAFVQRGRSHQQILKFPRSPFKVQTLPALQHKTDLSIMSPGAALQLTLIHTERDLFALKSMIQFAHVKLLIK